jgi:hypothetical protein
VNEFSVFGVSAAASLLAGTLIHTWGWNVVLWSTAPLLIGTAAVLLLFGKRLKAAQGGLTARDLPISPSRPDAGA